MPEETKQLLRELHADLEFVRTELHESRATQAQLAAAFEGQAEAQRESAAVVRRVRVLARILTGVVVVLTVALVVASIAAYQAFQEGHQRRNSITKQVSDLACLLVEPYPDSLAPVIPIFRKKYHCPPYNPQQAQQFQPAPTASPSN